MKRLLSIVGLALAFASAARAQNPDLLARIRLDEHRVVLASERMARFLQHYTLASPERREQARALFEKRRPTAGSVHWSPGFDLLRSVESSLSEPGDVGPDSADPSDEWRRLDALAGSLDLVAVPGAFEVGTAAPPMPITVRVQRVWGDASANVVLDLSWIDSTGAQSHARREPIDAAAITARGFEMYLRGPKCEEGRCYLFGKVERAQSSEFAAVVSEVRIDAVRDLRERVAALRARTLEGHPGYERLRELTTRLLTTGLRGSMALGGGDMLQALERWGEGGPPTGLPVPLETCFVDAQSVEHWVWTYSPEHTPERSIALLSPVAECADSMLAGPIGAQWMQIAERARAQLFATHVPATAEDVGPFLDRLRAWAGGRELIVVVRGDAVARLKSGVAGLEKPPFDAIVVSTSIPGDSAASLFPQAPMLLVAPEPAPAPREGLEWSAGERVWALNDIELCALVARWIERRAERR